MRSAQGCKFILCTSSVEYQKASEILAADLNLSVFPILVKQKKPGLIVEEPGVYFFLALCFLLSSEGVPFLASTIQNRQSR
jgi:hypothetical protein